MALHTSLPIYKEAYDLLGHAIELARNLPRDLKKLIGDRFIDGCLKISDLIRQANIARNKSEILGELLAHLDELQLLLRCSRDRRYISTGQYAKAIEYTTSIGRQASGWRKRFTPAT